MSNVFSRTSHELSIIIINAMVNWTILLSAVVQVFMMTWCSSDHPDSIKLNLRTHVSEAHKEQELLITSMLRGPPRNFLGRPYKLNFGG